MKIVSTSGIGNLEPISIRPVNRPPNCPAMETKMENRVENMLSPIMQRFNRPEKFNIGIWSIDSNMEEHKPSGIARGARQGAVITDNMSVKSNNETIDATTG